MSEERWYMEEQDAREAEVQGASDPASQSVVQEETSPGAL